MTLKSNKLRSYYVSWNSLYFSATHNYEYTKIVKSFVTIVILRSPVSLTRNVGIALLK